MSDTLQYRIPSKQSIKKEGVFREVPTANFKDGFVIVPFVGDIGYWFEAGRFEDQPVVKKQNPLCYSKEEYILKADAFIEQIIERKLSKAIFSRIKESKVSSDLELIYSRLCDAYPNAFVYLISSNLFGTWVGATPEVLMSSANGLAHTISLAGTKKSDDISLWGSKEINEQQYVTDFITDNLSEWKFSNIKQSPPYDLLAGPVKHIATNFEFSIENRNLLEIVMKLHPTPAVSGLPRDKSLTLIDRVEDHNRSLYAGFIGVIGEESNLFVNLRCAQIIENDCYLYLGGGFTKDSDSEKEWVETENKSRTLLDIIEKE